MYDKASLVEAIRGERGDRDRGERGVCRFKRSSPTLFGSAELSAIDIVSYSSQENEYPMNVANLGGC